MDWTLLIWTGAGLVGLTFLAAIWITIVESDRVYEWRQQKVRRRFNRWINEPEGKWNKEMYDKLQAEMLADQNKGLGTKQSRTAPRAHRPRPDR